jgi:hypothetical protein
MEGAEDAVPAVTPMRMHLLTNDLQRVHTDTSEIATLMLAIEMEIVRVREHIEISTEIAFRTHNDAITAANAQITASMDALINTMNQLRVRVHEGERNANEFYTRSIDVFLSHRKAGHPLRPRSAPFMADIRQTALGGETLIEDDNTPSAELLNLSLF